MVQKKLEMNHVLKPNVILQKIYYHWRRAFRFETFGRKKAKTFQCLHNTVNDLQFLTRILKFQRVSLTKKRDENDVQKVWVRYFGVLHHQQGRYERRTCRWYTIQCSRFFKIAFELKLVEQNTPACLFGPIFWQPTMTSFCTKKKSSKNSLTKYWRKTTEGKYAKFQDKALAARKFKRKENCEKKNTEKRPSMYNFVQKTNAASNFDGIFYQIRHRAFLTRFSPESVLVCTLTLSETGVFVLEIPRGGGTLCLPPPPPPPSPGKHHVSCYPFQNPIKQS